MRRTVKIHDRELEMRFTLRSLFIYETLAGKPYEGKLLQDAYILCYATLLAYNPDTFSMSFSEFIEECDGNPEIFGTFLELMEDRRKLKDQESPEDGKKKAPESR